MSTGGTPGRPWGPIRGDTQEAEALARFLRHQMDSSSRTLREMGDRLAYSRSRMSEYLSGRSLPPWQFVYDFIHAVTPPQLRERRMAEARQLHRSAAVAKAGRDAVQTSAGRQSEALEQVVEAQRQTIEMAEKLSQALERNAVLTEQLLKSQQLIAILLQLAFSRNSIAGSVVKSE
ncbi:helix-turn-helix domain-containing protein [Streptomyces sp. NPDC059761]|uniref:helix-turn-helix domain-containing protein n=1 Tax=Streptomyces sp. NPDC059761 TaxID=3346937 RepID=UPI003669012F